MSISSCHPTSRIITLPHRFTPRDYQRELMDAIFKKRYKHVYALIHRRAGKTLNGVNLITMRALEVPGLHIYLFPQTNQCRKVIWKGRGSDGIPFLDRIPREIIKKINNSEMSVELHNGSIEQFVGSNNFDALVGINAQTIVYDEYPIQDPQAREYLSPILLENGGTEIILGTPRGHNHAYDVYQMALNNPDWFVQRMTVEDTRREDGTPIITEEMLHVERRNGVSEEIIQQEYYCSFEIGNQGAYYTEQLAQAEYEHRIVELNISPSQPVHTVWDIGVRDATAIILFQSDGYMLNIIGYLEGNNKGVDWYWHELNQMQHKLGFRRWGSHWAPHDIRVREWGNSARSRLASAADIGLHFQVIPRLTEQDNINAGRSIFPFCKFHATNAKRLLLCLREAMREYDEERRIYKEKPFENWAIHGFDAFNYMGVVWRHQFAHPDMNLPRTYVSNF